MKKKILSLFIATLTLTALFTGCKGNVGEIATDDAGNTYVQLSDTPDINEIGGNVADEVKENNEDKYIFSNTPAQDASFIQIGENDTVYLERAYEGSYNDLCLTEGTNDFGGYTTLLPADAQLQIGPFVFTAGEITNRTILDQIKDYYGEENMAAVERNDNYDYPKEHIVEINSGFTDYEKWVAEDIQEFRIFPVLTGNEFIRTDLALTIYLDDDGNVYRIQNEGTEGYTPEFKDYIFSGEARED